MITSNIWKLQSVKVDVSYNYDVDDVAIVVDTNYTLNASDDCRLFISYDFQSDGALEIIFNEGFCGNVKDYSDGNWSLNSNGDLLTLSNPNVGNAAVGEGATSTNTSSEVVTRVVRIDASQMVLELKADGEQLREALNAQYAGTPVDLQIQEMEETVMYTFVSNN